MEDHQTCIDFVSDCHSVHAEQNAMMSASRKDMLGSKMYLVCEENGKEITDVSPCPICKRMIDNSGISNVITRRDLK